MTSDSIRSTFTTFFEGRNHKCVPSSSLLPDNDRSVLLTTAGMQQFKPYFLGERDPVRDFGSRRLCSVQRCFRTSDIDEVGDTTHNTFFEMLGNFSIADYFKKEAIEYAWSFLHQALHIPTEKIWITIFAGDANVPRDTESETLWTQFVPLSRIVAFDRSDNFWGPAGQSGPCGPSSELHLDLKGRPCDKGAGCRPNCACGRFMEVWNLVFTEYEKMDDGTFRPLATKNIDTGMGLERLALFLQRVPSIFDTDLFRRILDAVQTLEPLNRHPAGERQIRHRIVADHLRAAVFLLADGVLFSNKDQGYILRRLVRRAIDQCENPTVSFASVVDAVVRTYRASSPYLADHRDQIIQALETEQQTYLQVLTVEIERVLKKIRHQPDAAKMPEPSVRALTPEEAFALYSTHGVSPNRLRREGYAFDQQAFQGLIDQHQAKSRSGSEKKFGGHGLGHAVDTGAYTPAEVWTVTRLHSATHLLHAALRQVLGSEVRQNGSDINPERLRFDFTFPRKLTEAERQAIEALINQKTGEDLTVRWELLPYAEALRQGALAFFREKYDDTVKVYSMGDFSKELCGGPHVEHTAQVGTVKILSEKSISAGIRRIKAVLQDIA